MSNLSNTDEMLEVIGQVLIRCFIIGIFVLLFWGCGILLAGNLAFSVHSKIILSISQQQFVTIHYAGMLITKIAIFVLFLFPYIAIRLVISKRGK